MYRNIKPSDYNVRKQLQIKKCFMPSDGRTTMTCGNNFRQMIT